MLIVAAGLSLVACGGSTQRVSTAEPEAGGGESAPTAEERPPRRLDDEEAARAQSQAMQAHLRAREFSSQCDEDGDAAACEQAETFYRVAADTWRALVEGRPDDDGAIDWSFMLAQALFHSGSFEDAAESAARYLESGADQWRVQAARILVPARERGLSQEMHGMRSEPPEPRGQPPTIEPLDIPDRVRALFAARALFLEKVTAAEDTDGLRRRYALDNAVLLHRYGHIAPAQAAYRGVFTDGCAGEAAWEGAAIAWRGLRDIALSLGRYDAVRALGEELTAGECDFGDSPSCGAEETNPHCLARSDRVSGQLHGAGRFMQRAEHGRGAERVRWAGRAGAAFVEAIAPGNDLAPVARVTALVGAGRAFRMAGDRDNASQIDARIIAEVDPGDLEPDDRSFAVVTVASALKRQLEAALVARDHEGVVRLAGRLVGPEFDLPELSEERARARSLLPEALVSLGRHAEASRAHGEVARTSSDPVRRRRAELASALELVAAGPCSRALRPLRAFAQSHGDEAGATDDVITALFSIAECQRGRARTSALAAVVAAGQGGHLSADARGHVAEATFAQVDTGLEAFSRTTIRLPRVDTVEDLVGALDSALVAPVARAREMVEDYARVEAVGDSRWTAAARYESGRVLAALAQIVRDAAWQLPNDLQRQRRSLTAESFAQLRGITETRVQQILHARALTFSCRAASHHRRAVAAANRDNIRSDRALAAREQVAQAPAGCRAAR